MSAQEKRGSEHDRQNRNDRQRSAQRSAQRRVLIIPENRRGHGTGHFRRCMRLSAELLQQNCMVQWYLPHAPEKDGYALEEMGTLIHEDLSWIECIVDRTQTFDVVVMDLRECAAEMLNQLPSDCLTVAIDPRGDLRTFSDCVIDTMPLESTPQEDSQLQEPNIYDTAFQYRPRNRRETWPRELRRVIVLFGGEDRDEHTIAVSTALRNTLPDSVELTAVLHDASKSVPANILTRAPSPNIAEELHSYDLVVSHYGLTLWEALWARVPVIALNPTDHHQQLAEAATIPGYQDIQGLRIGVSDFDGLLQQCSRIVQPEQRSLGAFVTACYCPDFDSSARIDGETNSEPQRRDAAIQRFPDRTFFRHHATGLVYMKRFHGDQIDYDHDYFFREYQQQYGRTYLEDFPQIVAMGRRRVADIARFVPPPTTPAGVRRYAQTPTAEPTVGTEPTVEPKVGTEQGVGSQDRAERRATTPHVLDVGCAYGPFLVAATEAGWSAEGIDLNEEAVDYIRETLKLPARAVDLATMRSEDFLQRPDIITMWYVIEHVPQLHALLDQIADILPAGGIFAFSTPHGGGVSYRRNRRAFLSNSPKDHVTIWDTSSARAVLRLHGFSIAHIRVTGHHPERFGSHIPRWLYPVVSLWSRVRGLGDTFEIIARREVT